MKTIRCNDCDGEGTVETERACPDPIRGGELVGVIEECPTCDGAGEVEEDINLQWDDMKNG